MTPLPLATPAGAFARPRVFASAREVPRAPHSAGTPGLCRAGATPTQSLHYRTTPCLPVPSASAKLRAACSAVVLLPAAAAAAAPLDPAAVETVQQVLCPLKCTLERCGAHLRRAAAPKVGAVLNVAAAPLALVFSAVLFLFTSLKGDLAELEKDQKVLGKKTDDLGKKTDDLGKKTDDLGNDLKSSQTVVLGLLSLLTLFSAYSAFAAPK